jgi:hypothetical protein
LHHLLSCSKASDSSIPLSSLSLNPAASSSSPQQQALNALSVNVKPIEQKLIDWEKIYQLRYRIAQNWLTGQFHLRRLVGHEESIYTLQFDSGRMNFFTENF